MKFDIPWEFDTPRRFDTPSQVPLFFEYESITVNREVETEKKSLKSEEILMSVT